MPDAIADATAMLLLMPFTPSYDVAIGAMLPLTPRYASDAAAADADDCAFIAEPHMAYATRFR